MNQTQTKMYSRVLIAIAIFLEIFSSALPDPYAHYVGAAGTALLAASMFLISGKIPSLPGGVQSG